MFPFTPHTTPRLNFFRAVSYFVVRQIKKTGNSKTILQWGKDKLFLKLYTLFVEIGTTIAMVEF